MLLKNANSTSTTTSRTIRTSVIRTSEPNDDQPSAKRARHAPTVTGCTFLVRHANAGPRRRRLAVVRACAEKLRHVGPLLSLVLAFDDGTPAEAASSRSFVVSVLPGKWESAAMPLTELFWRTSNKFHARALVHYNYATMAVAKIAVEGRGDTKDMSASLFGPQHPLRQAQPTHVEILLGHGHLSATVTTRGQPFFGSTPFGFTTAPVKPRRCAAIGIVFVEPPAALLRSTRSRDSDHTVAWLLRDLVSAAETEVPECLARHLALVSTDPREIEVLAIPETIAA